MVRRTRSSGSFQDRYVPLHDLGHHDARFRSLSRRPRKVNPVLESKGFVDCLGLKFA